MMGNRSDHLTEDQLHGAAEESLAGDEAHAVHRHMKACARCRHTVESLRMLLAKARELPPAIEPPDELWLALREKVTAAHVGGYIVPGWGPAARDAARPIPASRRPRREYAWLAAAALLLVVMTSAITMLVVRDSRPLASAPAGVGDDTLEGPARFRAVNAQYERLDRDLARQLDEQRENLQPETIEKVERNLEVIDRAIEEIRQALAEDPNNEALEQLLKASYGQKSALVQQVSQS